MTTERSAQIMSNLPIPPGEILEEELKTVGMTQADLAARTGRPAQAINEIIRGRKSLTHDTALELEKVLGILPALETPTISTLADAQWVAINTVIEEKLVTELFPQLSEAGVRGIVEYPLNKIIE